MNQAAVPPPDPATASALARRWDVFRVFLLLGLTSFGGPVAHLGYFRHAFVQHRRWLTDADYADLVALCQFLPGPASSQVGFALGLWRAGPWGAALAWLAFTLPSAVILVLFAWGASAVQGPIGDGILHGLKVVAVAIVAQAIWGMAHALCPDRTRAAIALVAVAVVAAVAGPGGQVLAIGLGGLAGLLWCRSGTTRVVSQLHFPVSRTAGHYALAAFFGLLVGLPLMTWLVPTPALAVVDAFYRAGALVFGGGHVVLPLLEAEVVQNGWVTPAAFVAGYGAAQAVPGPLFTFAAYLGAVLPVWPHGVAGAALALVAIFAPGFLLLVGVLPYWNTFRGWARTQALMRGANAAVVGILAAALYQPVFTQAVLSSRDFALALAGFVLLVRWRCPAWLVVVLVALGGILTVAPSA